MAKYVPGECPCGCRQGAGDGAKEYRVVDKNDKIVPAMTNGKSVIRLVAMMNNTPTVYRHGPYRVEVRNVGEWRKVEGSDE